MGSSIRPHPPNEQRFSHPPGAHIQGNYFLREAPPRGFRRLCAFPGSRDRSRSSCSTESEPKLFSRASTGSLGSVGLRISSIFVAQPVLAGGSRDSYLGSLQFLRVQSAPRGVSLSSPREKHWLPWVQGGWRSLLLYFLYYGRGVGTPPWRTSITSWATLPNLGLEFEGCESCCEGVHHWVLCYHGLIAGIRKIPPPLPVEEARASSGMGPRAPGSLRGSSAGVSITRSPVAMGGSSAGVSINGSPVVMGPSLRLGYSPPFPSRGRSLRFLRDGVQSTRVTKGECRWGVFRKF